jgi:hypothetical protein
LWYAKGPRGIENTKKPYFQFLHLSSPPAHAPAKTLLPYSGKNKGIRLGFSGNTKATKVKLLKIRFIHTKSGSKRMASLFFPGCFPSTPNNKIFRSFSPVGEMSGVKLAGGQGQRG